MTNRTLATLLVFVLAITAAQAARLKLPAEETYIYWMSYTDPDGEERITPPEKAEGPNDKLDYSVLGVEPKNVVLTVLQTETGNVAVHPLKPEDGELPAAVALKEPDFDRVRNVSVTVVSKEGKPVESALVSLTDAANKTVTKLIEPTSQGVAGFQDVAAGLATVRITCAGRKSVNDVDVPLERKTAAFSTEIPIPGDVPTLDAVAAATEGEEPAAESSGGRRRYGPDMLVQTFVGLLFLGLVAYVGFTVARSRGMTLAGVLRRTGVQFPGDSQPQPAPPAPESRIDPGICQFCGQRKDQTTGACGCTVAAESSAAPASDPRLVGIAGPYLGRIFQLEGDILTIGREEGNHVALAEDGTTSRRHARITNQAGQLLIQDEGSANGTLLNGVRISEPRPLSAGDEIQIGSTRFRFEG